MKGINHIKKGIFLTGMLFMVLTVSAFGRQKGHTEEKAFTHGRGMAKAGQADVLRGAVQLTPVDEEYVLEDGVFSFGQLRIALPEEMWEEAQAGAIDMEDGSRAACLWSDEYICPAEIKFYHYRAQWQQEPLHMHSLACALMELTGTDSMQCRYMDRSEGELSFVAKDAGQSYCVLVQGQDIYLVEEIDSYLHFSFWNFYYSKLVTWVDTGKETKISGDSIGYVRAEEPDGNSFFMIRENDRYSLYKNDSLKTPVQVLYKGESRGEITSGKDINFDGYPDLCSYQDYYLYHSETETFEKAELGEGIYIPYDACFFEETKTIWMSVSEYGHDVPDREQLWQWEGNELVLKRECTEEYRDGEITVRAWDAGTDSELFAVSFPKEEYGQDPAQLKALYERFYDGYVPKETYYLEHWASGEISYIPDGLIKLLTEAMQDGTELETLQALVNDRELTDEEIREIGLANAEIRYEVAETETTGSFLAAMGDGDNDGIDDILAEVYTGGTGGFTEAVFFKGQPDGSFVLTSRYSQIMEEFALISYEGKNYLCRTTFDYNKKIYNGVCLYYYEEGKRREEVCLRFAPVTYQIKADYAAKDYKSYAEAYFTAESCMDMNQKMEQYDLITGGAETKDEGGFSCDLDNDGEQESYVKYIWYPSNMSTRNCLEFSCEDLPVAEEAIYRSGNEGVPIMMWAEEKDGTNIMNVLYQTGLYDFYAAGFLLEEETYEQVYGVECRAESTVEVNRYFLYE